MFSVNHVLKFKFLAKRMLYAKVDCSLLNPDVKRLIYRHGAFSECAHYGIPYGLQTILVLKFKLKIY